MVLGGLVELDGSLVKYGTFSQPVSIFHSQSPYTSCIDSASFSAF